MHEFPTTLVTAHTTDVYDQDTIPDELRTRHETPNGLWAFIRVLKGSLRYVVLEDDGTEQVVVLTGGMPGIIEPEVPHRVEPIGPVRFYIQFFRDAGTDPT